MESIHEKPEINLKPTTPANNKIVSKVTAKLSFVLNTFTIELAMI